MNHNPAGIYIHVPFCIKKCKYCDFYSITDIGMMTSFVHALISEIKLSPHIFYHFDSIYFGGGTPSLLSPQHISDIVQILVKQFHFADNIEITLESNPKTIDMELLRGFKDAGVNRIHLGVQSFSDPYLTFLGRVHSAKDTIEAIKMIQKTGFSNMGVDLIYGLPQQTVGQWRDELSYAASFLPGHLSCYMLTYEPGTPLEKELRKGKFNALPDAQTAALFKTTVETLSANGYFQYEISNFARTVKQANGKPDTLTYRSRHNQKYWNFSPYIGFGPSAHSFKPPIRYWNVGNIHDYMAIINTQKLPVEDQESLTTDQQIMEVISLRLRTSEGINMKAFEDEFGISFHDTFSPAVDNLIGDDLLLISSDHLKTTLKGMLVLNKIVEMLIDLI